MDRSLIIIGSGVGGLSAGIYGRLCGFRTTVFEAHSVPGGQCTSWNRKGYVFDPTIHNFNGFRPGTRINAFWRELGALPCEMLTREEFVRAVFPDGTEIRDYIRPEKLGTHLREIASEDAAVIDELVRGLQSFVTDLDWFGINYFGSPFEKLSILPFFIARAKYFRHTLDSFARRFTNPELRMAFPFIRNSIPQIPLFAYLVEHANFIIGDSGWPKGGSAAIARNMTSRYLELGGILRCKAEVVRILVENDRACGIELADGTRHTADFIVSNADGRKTVLKLLDGKYTNEKVAGYCRENPPDRDVPMAVQVFLGVRRDLSRYPFSQMVFLEKPETIGGLEHDHLDLQCYGFDTSMAPAGRGVMKIELPGKPSYFSALAHDGNVYVEAKARIADRVTAALEKRFPGLRDDIEAIDVCTLNTWERFMGGTQGWNNFPNRYGQTGIRNVLNVLFGTGRMFTLPGLDNFYFSGQWVTSMGSLFMNAASGREVVRKICRRCGIRFGETGLTSPAASEYRSSV